MKIDELEKMTQTPSKSRQQEILDVSARSFDTVALPPDLIMIDRGKGLEYMVVTSDGRYVPVEEWWG